MLIGALGQGENPSSTEANDALLTLNEIVDKWNTESLMIPFSSNIELNLSGKEKYTIGINGDANVNRPVAGIDSAYFYYTDKSCTPITVLTSDQYDNLPVKDINSNFINYVYYNATYPLAELYVYPVCNSGKLVLSTNGQFEMFDNLDTVIDLPSGYIKALRYNLAVELSDEYGKSASQNVLELAIGAKASIKNTNSANKPKLLRVDNALLGKRGGFNIRTGE